MVRVHDDNRIRVRHVEARFDNARTHQHVEILSEEGVHHAFQFAVFHLAVGHGDAGVGHPAFHIFGEHIDALDAVVHDKDLAPTGKFVFYRGREHDIVALEKLCLYGQAVHRGRIDERDVADARHAQL